MALGLGQRLYFAKPSLGLADQPTVARTAAPGDLVACLLRACGRLALLVAAEVFDDPDSAPTALVGGRHISPGE
jgi:hypothetical protein